MRRHLSSGMIRALCSADDLGLVRVQQHRVPDFRGGVAPQTAAALTTRGLLRRAPIPGIRDAACYVPTVAGRGLLAELSGGAW